MSTSTVGPGVARSNPSAGILETNFKEETETEWTFRTLLCTAIFYWHFAYFENTFLANKEKFNTNLDFNDLLKTILMINL